MGSIAGYRTQPSDISFIYRFLFTIAKFDLNQKIERIQIQLCDNYGINVLESWYKEIDKVENEELREYFSDNINQVNEMIKKYNVELFTLDDLLSKYEFEKSLFWS